MLPFISKLFDTNNREISRLSPIIGEINAREEKLKKFKEKAFAKGANRESILLCEEKLGIPLAKFIEINLTAMQSISDDIGL